jgi:hypothetical protein
VKVAFAARNIKSSAEDVTLYIGDVCACWTKSVFPVRPYSLLLFVEIRSKTGGN